MPEALRKLLLLVAPAAAAPAAAAPASRAEAVGLGSAWRLFAADMVEVAKALRREGLPNAQHRLIWRTSHTGHPDCQRHTRPYASEGVRRKRRQPK